MDAPRVGLIGARRSRQGLGPFVARHLRAAGALVPCFLGTSADSVRAAERDLAQRFGVEARGYTDLNEMLVRESLDALAVLSPAETHETYLRSALEARLHVLCEKPLLWEGERLAERARALEEDFQAHGLLLWENCQWPFALPAFGDLHPGVLEQSPRRFGMRLSPASLGVQMLGDSLPHPLSLLQALAPCDQARVADARFSTANRGSSERPSHSGNLSLSFEYHTAGERVEAEVELTQSDKLPREAAFSVNGHWAHRRVEGPEYSIRFTSDSRSVEVRDPLRGLIDAFVTDLRGLSEGRKSRPGALISQRMQMLETLLHAFLKWSQ